MSIGRGPASLRAVARVGHVAPRWSPEALKTHDPNPAHARLVRRSRKQRNAVSLGLVSAGSALLVVLAALACSPPAPEGDRDGVPDRADQRSETRVGRGVNAQGASNPDEALSRAIDALLAQPSFTVSDIWVLQRLIRIRPHAGLERLVELWKGKLAAEPQGRLIDPGAPRVPLPEDPGQGVQRFYQYVQAPFGRPESRALAFIRDFVSSDETGYVLTHQFLVIEWAKQSGLDLPEAVVAMRPRLLERIAVEQGADARFSDLFTERAALLIQFAESPPSAGPDWIEVLLAAQHPEGGWEDPAPTVIDFYGQRLQSWHPRSHTMSWATLALAAFSQRY